MWTKDRNFNMNHADRSGGTMKMCRYRNSSSDSVVKELEFISYSSGGYQVIATAGSASKYTPLKTALMAVGFLKPNFADKDSKIFRLKCNDLSLVAAFLKTIKTVETSITEIEQEICSILHIDLSQDMVVD